jgi:hypothetical protein
VPALLGKDVFYNDIEKHFALAPQERLRAVRDALMSWGFLTNPPPLAEKAGPRPDAYIGGDAK